MIDFKQIIAESIAQITKIEVNEIKGIYRSFQKNKEMEIMHFLVSNLQKH